ATEIASCVALALENARRHAAVLAELGQRAGERERLFEAEHRARREAEEALRVRDQVLAAVSHDLRSPLTVIRVVSQVLGRRVGQALPPEERERLEIGLRQIESATRKMTRWIEELSDVARLRLGQDLPLDRHPVDLVALARRLAAEHQRAVEQHRI